MNTTSPMATAVTMTDSPIETVQPNTMPTAAFMNKEVILFSNLNRLYLSIYFNSIFGGLFPKQVNKSSCLSLRGLGQNLTYIRQGLLRRLNLARACRTLLADLLLFA
jgi:hypothetical protein